MSKTFIIKDQELKIITIPDGRRILTPESIAILMRLTMQHRDSLRKDKGAIAMGTYLKGEALKSSKTP